MVLADKYLWPAIAVAGCLLAPLNANSADLGQTPQLVEPAPPPSGWEFSVTPYAWATSVNGNATARGHTVDFDESFIDIIEKSDSIMALMGYAEARKGRFALFTDAVWEDLSFSAHTSESINRRVAGNPFQNFPNVTVVAKANLDLAAHADMDYTATIIQSGAGYEIAKWSNGSSVTHFDVLAGARYWNEETKVSVNLSGDLTADITGIARVDAKEILKFVLEERGLQLSPRKAKLIRRLIAQRAPQAVIERTIQLEISRAFATAASGDLEWVDPFVGARIRHEFGNNKTVTLEGDIGGFGAGSEFSWQVVGTYGFDVNVFGSTMHSIVGYRALAVDYSENGRFGKNGIDYLQHGPLLGAKFNW
jgi:hypothetical protein